MLTCSNEFEGSDKQTLITLIEKFYDVDEQEHTATERSVTMSKKKKN